MRKSEPSERAPRHWAAAVLVCALIAAYAGFSHYCNAGGDRQDLGAALALGPLLAVGLTLVWRSGGVLVALVSALFGGVLLYDWWPLFEKNFPLVYLLQECGMYGLLAFGFGRSLRVGRTALCTQFADQLHGPLTPAEIRYTRQVTFAWTLLFTAITATTLLLFVSAPRKVWSLFVNFGTIPLVAAMFVVEYAVRRRLLPKTDRRGVLASVRIFLASR